MSSRLALCKLSFCLFVLCCFYHHYVSLCFLFVLRIAPNSLVVIHSHIAAFCWVGFPWVPFPAPCGCPVETAQSSGQTQGVLLKQNCCPTFLFADSDLDWELWAALHGSSPWASSQGGGQDKGEAAGAVWEHLICTLDFNRSVKQWLPSSLASFCVVWRGWEMLIWAGLEGRELGLWFSNQRCILPGAVQAHICDSVLDGSLINGF